MYLSHFCESKAIFDELDGPEFHKLFEFGVQSLARWRLPPRIWFSKIGTSVFAQLFDDFHLTIAVLRFYEQQEMFRHKSDIAPPPISAYSCGFHLIWIADVPGKPGTGPGTHKIDSLVAAYLSPKRWRQRRDSDGNDFQRLPTDFKGSKGRRKGWRRHSLLSKAMQVIRIWITRTGFPGS